MGNIKLDGKKLKPKLSASLHNTFIIERNI